MSAQPGTSRRSIIIGAVFAAIAAVCILAYGPVAGSHASANSLVMPRDKSLATDELVALASPGRIEAESDVVEVGAAIDGVIHTVYVKEGQQVSRGQVLAALDCRQLSSALPLA